MPPSVQSIIALLLVALAALWLVRQGFKRRRKGCGDGGCGAVSPDVRRMKDAVKRR